MNKYGVQASDYWRRADRARYDRLEDPEVFFTDLGEQVLLRVEALTSEMTRSAAPAASYLEEVGTVNAIRKQAEELAMQELVFIEAVPSSTAERVEWAEMQAPSEERLQELMTSLQERESEMSTEDFEAEMTRLEGLRNRV